MAIFKRKILLINPRFQLSMIGWFLGLSIILILVFYTTNWFFFYNFKQKASLAGLPPEHVLYQFLDLQKIHMNKIFAIASAVTLMILFLGGLWISHRIAGPLDRLTKHLNKSSQDDVGPVDFRNGDYFIEVKDAFNAYLARKNK